MPVREPVGLLPGSDDRPADAIVRTILLKYSCQCYRLPRWSQKEQGTVGR